ncbi:MAG: ribonuclease R [Erysipelotrichaceae bacterium]|nr:ribonuclease R [Erysipelotrichaceae bacterium]
MKEKLLEIFLNDFNHPLDIDELFEILGLSDAHDFTLLAKCLNELEDEFIITHNHKGLFAPMSYFNLSVGVLDVKDGGYGFVDTPSGGVFVKASNFKGAITYDTVMIKEFTDDLGRKEGIVERIIKRGNEYFYGELLFYKGKYFVYSVDSKIKLTIFISKFDLAKAKPHQMVKVKVNKYFPNHTADGEVVKILGNTHDSGMDITALVLSAGIKTDFPEEVILELEDIPDEISKLDYPNRKDLTDKLIITIDGIDAKDLDDAVRVEILDNGNYLLGVYIADVSNYVKEGTFLDLEAFERGTSVYLPDRVIPMLPKKLSNGICSLNEGVDRLVMCCEMEIDNNGNVVNSEIFEGVINSRHRMTYDDVNMILKGDKELINKYQDIHDMLLNANKLSKILKNKRVVRGAFMFETPEAKIILNEKGNVVDIVLRQRFDAECLIEEFMLISNECVAETMTWLDVPFIYRVHEEPADDKVSKLMLMINNFGYDYKIKGQKSVSRLLQKILKDHDLNEPGLSQEDITRRGIVNKALIRTMAKAKYQETNIGHFGLGSKCYTHFTSPIRRYPDLLVHRLIKEFMFNESFVSVSDKVGFYNSKVNAAGVNSSKTERIAEKLERDACDYKKCEYMERFYGDKFVGTISSIMNFGAFITLDNTVEGMCRFADMHDDYYVYDEARMCFVGNKFKITYSLGDRVKVRVMNVCKETREVNFRILGKEINRGK